MITKQFCTRQGRVFVQVTFTLPESLWADQIHLVGDFNGWHRTSHPLGRDRQGRWTLTVDLERGRAYQFRYLCDVQTWTSIYPAEAYVRGPGGIDNFVVVTA
jgi:1,4-alpha-glucan branching enzyme